MDIDAPGVITGLLRKAAEGDHKSAEQLFDALYGRLRDLAQAQMRAAAPGETLQPTALVHEAWLRLSSGTGCDWQDREHFLAVAARAMRFALVDAARRRGSVRRGGAEVHEEMAQVVPLFESHGTSLVALDEALQRLGERNEDQARVVELRFFGGMTMEEAARALDVSRATAERLWYLARGWLRKELAH